MTEQPQTFEFQAEVRQVLDLVVHSLYSNRDIFLRELVSNASDACDKLRFAALSDPSLAGAGNSPQITIEVEPSTRRLRVIDNGIGMSREELIEQLGTIAHSGTRRYLEALGEAGRDGSQLIGQFGVGFYSAFIVADRIRVESRAVGADQANVWTSDAAGTFTVAEGDRLSHGTNVELDLKADADRYLEPATIRELVRNWSEHIAFPIVLKEIGDDGKPKLDDDKDGKPAEPKPINEGTALWKKPKAELTDDDYRGFYRQVSHDFGAPLAWSHNRVEGNNPYTSLLYVPEHAPFDRFSGDRDERRGLKLYIRRVFIMDAAREMLPSYLRFVRGVVDAEDLPLNVSREILQTDRGLERIASGIKRRVLELLEKLATDEPDNYKTFWKAHGQVLKEGLVESPEDREKLLPLLRFGASTAEPGETIGLGDYVAAMGESQDAIYYLAAEGETAARSSPLLEAWRAKDIPVLLLTDRIDPYIADALTEFQDKPFRSIADQEVLPPGIEAGEADTDNASVKRIGELLGDSVARVRASRRLTDSAACIVDGDGPSGGSLRRLMEMTGQTMPPVKPTLEVNTDHPLIAAIDAETDSERAKALAELLLDEARLLAGEPLPDPAAFVARLNKVIAPG